jgi:hypothetical protein
MIMRAVFALFFLFSTATAAVNKSEYFPKRAFGENQEQSATNYYGAWLSFFKEPSLLREAPEGAAKEVYRFLWLRTFHHAIVIRVDVAKDGTGNLVTKVSTGEAGFGMRNRKIIGETSRPVSRDDVQSLLTLINEKGFWTTPSYTKTDQTGTDGSEWVLEGMNGGKYHVVARWTPCDSSRSDKKDICAIGRMFTFDLAHLDIPKDEFY